MSGSEVEDGDARAWNLRKAPECLKCRRLMHRQRRFGRSSMRRWEIFPARHCGRDSGLKNRVGERVLNHRRKLVRDVPDAITAALDRGKSLCSDLGTLLTTSIGLWFAFLELVQCRLHVREVAGQASRRSAPAVD